MVSARQFLCSSSLLINSAHNGVSAKKEPQPSYVTFILESSDSNFVHPVDKPGHRWRRSNDPQLNSNTVM